MDCIFTLYPEVLIWCDPNRVVLYNSKKHKSLVFSSDSSLASKLRRLTELDMMYSFHFDDTDMEMTISLEKLQKDDFGIINAGNQYTLPPKLCIINNWDNITQGERQFSADVLSYLLSVSIQLGGSNSDIESYHCQTDYPISGNQVIDYSSVMRFLTSLSFAHVKELNLILSGLDTYDDILAIIEKAKSSCAKTTLFLKDNEINSRLFTKIVDIINVKLIHNLRGDVILPDRTYDNVSHVFLIESEDSFARYSSYCTSIGKEKCELIPVFNGRNERFVKEQVFLTEKEILNSRLDMRHIFMHQVLNTFYFGHLSVLPDGSVFSNNLTDRIGTIEDSLYTLIINAMNDENGWRKTRKVNGCGICAFVDLCPSPHVLEQMIGVSCICKDYLR